VVHRRHGQCRGGRSCPADGSAYVREELVGLGVPGSSFLRVVGLMSANSSEIVGSPFQRELGASATCLRSLHMPIRATRLVPIIAPPSTAESTLESGAENAGGSVLPVNRVAQQQTFWCWAACAEMVLALKGQSMSQCAIAGIALNRADCCSAGGATCNTTIPVADGPGSPSIMALYADPRIGVRATFLPGFLRQQELRDEIEARRPVQAAFDQTTTGHIVLVVGWQPDGSDARFLVHDPQDPPQQGFVTHFSLRTGFGTGSWRQTVFRIGG
jgi:hypothetical protein